MLTDAAIFDTLRQALFVAVVISVPILSVALIAGLAWVCRSNPATTSNRSVRRSRASGVPATSTPLVRWLGAGVGVIYCQSKSICPACRLAARNGSTAAAKESVLVSGKTRRATDRGRVLGVKIESAGFIKYRSYSDKSDWATRAILGGNRQTKPGRVPCH